MADLWAMLEHERDAAGIEFDALQSDADSATRERLAAQMAPAIARDMKHLPLATRSI